MNKKAYYDFLNSKNFMNDNIIYCDSANSKNSKGAYFNSVNSKNFMSGDAYYHSTNLKNSKDAYFDSTNSKNSKGAYYDFEEIFPNSTNSKNSNSSYYNSTNPKSFSNVHCVQSNSSKNLNPKSFNKFVHHNFQSSSSNANLDTRRRINFSPLKAIFLILFSVLFVFPAIVFAEDPNAVTGRFLKASRELGDDSDWLEIAKYHGYSLIYRTQCLPVGKIKFNSTTYTFDGYINSNAKNTVDIWFERLDANKRLKNYSVSNTAVINLGCFKSIDSEFARIYPFDKPNETLGTGISLPSLQGEKSAFLLSFQEAKMYIAYQYENGEQSSVTAYNNYQKLQKSAEENFIKLSWLRSPGQKLSSASCSGNLFIGGSISDEKISSKCFLRPALWVKSSIFGDPEPPQIIPGVAAPRAGFVLRRETTIEEDLSTLNSLVGMRDFKVLIGDLVISSKQYALDEAEGIHRNKPSLHMILTGEPGTGKTTVAQKLAEIYFNAGLIPQNKVVKVERADLVGQYIGQTEAIVRQKLEEAAGGILFIDEAYALANSGERDFGKHVIEGLLTPMEENRCVVIVAGYPNEMRTFLRTINPGLTRRLTHQVLLPNYSAEELCTMFESLCTDSNLILEDSAREVLIQYFDIARRRPNFGNAGYVKNFFDVVMRVRDRHLALNVQGTERRMIKTQYVEEAAKL